MQIPIGQWLDNASNYLSTQISLFVKWYQSDSGIKTRKLSAFWLKILLIANAYYAIYLFSKFIYSLAPTTEDGYKYILGVCGIVAFIWAFVKITIVIGRLAQRFRIFKREKIDIPLRVWFDDTFVKFKESKVVVAYWNALNRLTNLNELIINKLIIWTFHSVLEPELDSYNQKEFFSIEEIPSELKELHGKKVINRYKGIGESTALIWSFTNSVIVFWILSPIINLIKFISSLFGEVVSNIIMIPIMILLMVSVIGTSFVGALIAFGKRTQLWWLPQDVIQQEPQQQEYQELKEHLALKMNELTTATKQVISINEQLHQKTQALASLRKLEPELAGQVGILVNMIMEEEHAKSEVSERKKARNDLLKEITIGTIFFVLGLLITSDVVKSIFDKIMVFIKSLGS